ncbi:hypothetical protein [Cellulomonas fimi]|uniref:hypothetical protein n=1 Tax=Cellulomonas fimi TaxID=1708 RepID=UPI00235A17EC|nr:hypothetical protein [Cellulomonas fimi]
MTTDIGRDDAAGVALRERWRHESLGSVWLRPADWYHPAVDDLAGAVLGDRDPTLAAAELGRARGHDGVGIAETIDDLACLYRSRGVAQPPLLAVRALCDGWADAQAAAVAVGTSLDPESGLPTRQYLAVRLAETYQDGDRAALPAHESHHLVLVDVAAGAVDPFSRAARSAAVGAAMTATFGEGHPMATLGGGVFAVLSRRQDPLEERVSRLQAEIARRVERLEVRAATRQPVRVWVEPLPATHEQAVHTLRRVSRP